MVASRKGNKKIIALLNKPIKSEYIHKETLFDKLYCRKNNYLSVSKADFRVTKK